MSDDREETGTPTAHDEAWSQPQPAELPRPTFWPAILAVAICFGLWGVLTSPWLIVVGFAGVVLAATRWIGDLSHEPQD